MSVCMSICRQKLPRCVRKKNTFKKKRVDAIYKPYLRWPGQDRTLKFQSGLKEDFQSQMKLCVRPPNDPHFLKTGEVATLLISVQMGETTWGECGALSISLTGSCIAATPVLLPEPWHHPTWSKRTKIKRSIVITKKLATKVNSNRRMQLWSHWTDSLWLDLLMVTNTLGWIVLLCTSCFLGSFSL